MRRDPYSDSRCADGVFADGWRRVKRGGRIKAGGMWYSADQLEEIVGELVHVFMGEYWQGHITVHRGRIGCQGYYCRADREDD